MQIVLMIALMYHGPGPRKWDVKMSGEPPMDGKSAYQALRALPYKTASAFFSQRRFPLHAMLSSGGHSLENDPVYSWDGTARGRTSFAVLQLTIDGVGRLDTRGASRELAPQTLMLVHIPGAHRYYLPEGSAKWEFVYLVVYGRELLRIILGIERRQGNVITLSESSRIPGVFLSVLESLFSANSFTPYEISSLAYELCMQILIESYWVPDDVHASRFDALKTFLRENVQRDLPVSEMAQYARLSRSHFARLFKEHEGMSPREYVEDLRLKRALQLLYSETMSVKEIAFACGIPDVNYFCRLFKKHMGMSPGEYRRSGF